MLNKHTINNTINIQKTLFGHYVTTVLLKTMMRAFNTTFTFKRTFKCLENERILYPKSSQADTKDKYEELEYNLYVPLPAATVLLNVVL